MANRAYLYSADVIPDGEWENPFLAGVQYFDSRWTIPFAWWSFFNAGDSRLVTGDSDHHAWEDLVFATDRAVALTRFDAVRERLQAKVQDHLTSKHLEFLRRTVAAWPGAFLLMDPREVLEWDAHDDRRLYGDFLTRWHDPSLDVESLPTAVSEFSRIEPGDRAEVTIVGYTYGENDVWGDLFGHQAE